MKRNLLFVFFAVLSSVAFAQKIVYEHFKHSTTLMTSGGDDGNMYLSQDVDLMLPVSCSDPSVNVAAMRSTLIKEMFSGVEEMTGVKVRDTNSMVEFMKHYSLASDQNEYSPWRACSSIPEDVECFQNLGASYSLEENCVSGNVVFYTHMDHCYNGGAHGQTIVIYVGIDKRTGKKVELSHYLTPQQQARALQLISSRSGIQKYNVEKGMDYDQASQQASEVRNYIQGKYDFPTFYVKNNCLYFTFQAYDIDCYAAGPQTFRIPLSVLKGQGSATTTSSATRRSNTRPSTTRSRR